MRDAIGMQFIRGNLRPSVVLGGVHRHLMRDAISMQFRGVHHYRRRRETRQTIMRDAISMHSEYVVTGGAERRVRPSMVAAFGQTGAGRTLT